MRQLVKSITPAQVDQMILLKYHRRVTGPGALAFVSNATIGKVYGIDGSSVGRLIRDRFR